MDKLKTILQVFIPDHNRTVHLVFKQDAAHKVWVDWGDESYPDTYSYQGLIEAHHTYKLSGEYSITMEAVDEGYIILGGGWTGGNAFGGSDEAEARMLISVQVGTDVTGIESYAFRGCENLERITFPPNAEIDIGAFAFEGCNSLEEIVLPSNNSIVGNDMFSNCGSLRKVTLPNGTYEIGSYAFANCTHLKEINLLPPTRIKAHAFSNCRMLKSIKLGENCRFIEDGAFDSCSCIQSMILGQAKTIGKDAFHDNKSLTSIEIPNTVEEIEANAFAGCSSLKKIKMAATEPPVLGNETAFEHVDGMVILVPFGSARKYRTDTNWAVFADVIKEG